MDKLKKMILTPYFGNLPEWFQKFQPPDGYGWMLETRLEHFKQRVGDLLGIEYPGKFGEPKIWDYRCALGYLYQDELKGFDFWATADFDVIFGDINKFYPDSMLNEYDVISGHDTYVAGCFSLYRNKPDVNNIFMRSPSWREEMTNEKCSGWVEQEYSRTLEQSGYRYKYTFEQGWPWTQDPVLKKENKSLFQLIKNKWVEVAFFHFRHSKIWPL